MWKPAENLNWQSEATCAKPSNRYALDWFFSKDFKEKYAAKNMCFTCPVRSECLQWALEHRQIWGIWGGKDEVDIRRALSVSYSGEETRRRRFPNCPYCTARPAKLDTSIEQLPNGGRWTTAKVVTCTECGFAWRSRTSANAVEAYKADRLEKTSKKTKPKKSSSSKLVNPSPKQ
jgi:WhiB family transcriptional regulator, redox-sensing transcriptional regulator